MFSRTICTIVYAALSLNQNDDMKYLVNSAEYSN